jgi:hypothetical protein
MKSSRFTILPPLLVVIIALFVIGIIFIISSSPVNEKDHSDEFGTDVKHIEKQFSFSTPNIVGDHEFTNVYVQEANFNSIHDQWPVLPVNITTFEFAFGTRIIDVKTTFSESKTIPLSKDVAYGSCSTLTDESEDIYDSEDVYPSNVVSYHNGGGLSNGEHKTFLTLRIYPVTYSPSLDEVYFVDNVSVKISYKEPSEPLLADVDDYELLIISPDDFVNNLERLVTHKNHQGIRTRITTVEEIKKDRLGCDLQEGIKYFIKQEIEESGIDYVLLVGGRDRQSTRWNLPVRYSHVLIRPGTQEIIEPSFISDLYYADIYDSTGNFSAWNSNHNDVFAEFNETIIDEMDLYPDIALGRLPCRNKREVATIVDKIITYEKETKNSDWFENIILVSGDHWDDEAHINEGVLIMEEAAEIMDDFNPVELFATEDNNFLSRDIRKIMNDGAGFAYFCGHGGISAWGIHLPPDASGWAPTLTRLGLFNFYKNIYMNFLRNRNKLPVTVVGGCNNGQFDVSFFSMLQQGRITLSPHCWAWHVAIQKKGGSIATIANTGLGTHAMDDNDNNGVNDYLEIYDGWLELEFFRLYQHENIDMLGETQQEAIKTYLHRFLGAGDEMDIKMVQQWQLFGDPTLKIGGY